MNIFEFVFAVTAIAMSIVYAEENSNDDANSYEKYKLYKVIPTNEAQLEALHCLTNENDNYDVWRMSRLVNQQSEIMIPPADQSSFESKLGNLNITFERIVDNMAVVLNDEAKTESTIQMRFLKRASYYRYNDINNFLTDMAQEYPNLVTVRTVGKSHEKRNINTITIARSGGGRSKKKILIDGGIHAREWISPATAMYVINQLVENEQENSDLLDSFDFVIAPLINPDGYEFTHTKNRLWRKSRRPTGTRGCFGADLNRNFGFHWGEVGTSNQPCSQIYKGNKAFSEPEARVLRDLMLSFNGTCVLYLTLHSYGNYLLYPWGYTSYKLYKILPHNVQQLNLLHNISIENRHFDFLTLAKSIDHSPQVLVPPIHQVSFEARLSQNNISFDVIVDNVEQALKKVKSKSPTGRMFWWNNYPTLEQIYTQMEKMASENPNFVTTKSIGKSYQDRDILAIEISKKKVEPNERKRIILVDATIHAREWIAPVTALHIIEQLVDNSMNNSDLLDKFDWVIVPVANPDGYVYTHNSMRLWRKNRAPNGFFNCQGTDLNRNFGYHWGEGGASSFTCSETYKGWKPFSELESIALKDLMHSFRGQCAFYLTLHSFGQYLLYPWGYNNQQPKNHQELHALAMAGSTAILAATGTKYTVGSSGEVLYVAAGGSDDYAMGKANIDYAITMELPGGGLFGFDPPSSTVKGLVAESWMGIKAMALKLAELLHQRET